MFHGGDECLSVTVTLNTELYTSMIPDHKRVFFNITSTHLSIFTYFLPLPPSLSAAGRTSFPFCLVSGGAAAQLALAPHIRAFFIPFSSHQKCTTAAGKKKDL